MSLAIGPAERVASSGRTGRGSRRCCGSWPASSSPEGRPPRPTPSAGSTGRRRAPARRRPAAMRRFPSRRASGGRRARPAAARGPVPRPRAGDGRQSPPRSTRVGIGNLAVATSGSCRSGERQLVRLAMAVAQAARSSSWTSRPSTSTSATRSRRWSSSSTSTSATGMTSSRSSTTWGWRALLPAAGPLVGAGRGRRAPRDVLTDERVRSVFGVDVALTGGTATRVDRATVGD